MSRTECAIAVLVAIVAIAMADRMLHIWSYPYDLLCRPFVLL